MFKKEPITITEEQFVKAAAKATEKVFNETKDLEIILPMELWPPLFHVNYSMRWRGRLMAMRRLNYDRRCTC
mgnify:CR=1 FL=1